MMCYYGPGNIPSIYLSQYWMSEYISDVGHITDVLTDPVFRPEICSMRR